MDDEPPITVRRCATISLNPSAASAESAHNTTHAILPFPSLTKPASTTHIQNTHNFFWRSHNEPPPFEPVSVLDLVPSGMDPLMRWGSRDRSLPEVRELAPITARHDSEIRIYFP